MHQMTGAGHVQIRCPVAGFIHLAHLPLWRHGTARLDEQRRHPHRLPLPPVVAGTPLGYDFDPAAKTFGLRFSTTGPAGSAYLPPRGKGAVPASTPQTEVFVPERHFPSGYEVDVAGGGIASGPNAPLLRVVACRGVREVSVSIKRPGTAPVSGPDCAVSGASLESS